VKVSTKFEIDTSIRCLVIASELRILTYFASMSMVASWLWAGLGT